MCVMAAMTPTAPPGLDRECEEMAKNKHRTEAEPPHSYKLSARRHPELQGSNLAGPDFEALILDMLGISAVLEEHRSHLDEAGSEDATGIDDEEAIGPKEPQIMDPKEQRTNIEGSEAEETMGGPAAEPDR